VPGAAPGTAAGRLVTVSYALVARAAVERGRDARATEPVRVLAGRRALPDLSDGWVTGDAGVRLRCDVLSRRDVAPGDRLTGVLEVAAYEDLAAAALHLELVVVEDVPDVPPGHAETVVAALPLLPAQPWACGRAELVPFAFDLPPVLTAPTLRTGSASVDWELRGVLTAGPATAEVRVPLVARTGAREATPG
jgi:hypothetical protein